MNPPGATRRRQRCWRWAATSGEPSPTRACSTSNGGWSTACWPGHRAKTSLFATVAHELKNPLASIVGHLELLRRPPRGGRRLVPGRHRTQCPPAAGTGRRPAHLVEGAAIRIRRRQRPAGPGTPDAGRDDMFRPAADQRGITPDQRPARGVALVVGNAEELARGPGQPGEQRGEVQPDHGVVRLSTRRDTDTVYAALRRPGGSASPTRTRSHCSPSSSAAPTPKPCRCPARVWD